MGTEKYPNENEYSEFITNHGGYNNAWTSFTDTNHSSFDSYILTLPCPDVALSGQQASICSPLRMEKFVAMA